MKGRFFWGAFAVVFMCFLINEICFAEPSFEQINEASGEAYFAAEYQKALGLLQKGLDLAKKRRNKKWIGNFSTNLGIVNMGLGKYDKALSCYKDGLLIHQEIGDIREIGNSFTNLGVLYDDLGQYEKALTYCKRALEIKRELGDRQGEGKDISNIGAIYVNLGQYKKALACYEKALTIDRELEDRRSEGSSLTNLGVIYDGLGQYEKALTYCRQALEIKRELGDRRGEGRDLGNFGIVHMHLNQNEKAMNYYEQALAIDREIGNRRGEGKDLVNMGLAHMNLSHHEKAIKYFEQALAICQETGDRRGRGTVLGNIGAAYLHLGQYEKALPYCERALAIDRKIRNRSGEGADLANIGVIYEKLGQYEKALLHYKHALAIQKEIGARNGEAEALTNLAVLYKNIGQHGKSILHLEQSLAICREIGDRLGEGLALMNLGVIALSVGLDDRELLLFEKALAIQRELGDKRGEAETLYNMGLFFGEKEDYERALSLFNQSAAIHREIGDQAREALDFATMGALFNDMKQYEKGQKALSDSIRIYEKMGFYMHPWQALFLLASAEVGLNEISSAAMHYEQALEAIETMRQGIAQKDIKLSFMKNKIRVYDEFIDLLQSLHQKHPAKGYDRKSLEILEKKQSRIFLEEMGQSGARNFAGMPDAVLDGEIELDRKLSLLQRDRANEGGKPEQDREMERIRELEQRMEAVRADQEKLQKKIQDQYPDYYAIRHPKPAALSTLQSMVLRPDETLLIYGVLEEKTCLWVVNKNHFSLHTLDIGQSDLAVKIEQYRNGALSKSGYALRGKVLRLKSSEKKQMPDLYNLLTPEPVHKALADANTLYIVPTGPLYQLPFETLITENSESGPRYLIEDHPIAYLSSASLLKILRDAQARKKQIPQHPLLAFANPVYEADIETSSLRSSDEFDASGTIRGLRSQSYRALMGGNFSPLPETEDEVRAIKDLLNAPDDSRPLWLEADASRSNVFALNSTETLDDYRYVIFACHGILPEEIDRVTQPTLVLSDPDPQTAEAGYLTMADVFALSLNADLVALSACNTGRGKTVKGEGVMGLTRAFMYAGTPAITVTLWSVETHSAKTVNVGFFKNLKEGKGRAEALRDIKLDMIRGEYGEQWRKPFYWGPTVIFGDGQ